MWLPKKHFGEEYDPHSIYTYLHRGLPYVSENLKIIETYKNIKKYVGHKPSIAPYFGKMLVISIFKDHLSSPPAPNSPYNANLNSQDF